MSIKNDKQNNKVPCTHCQLEFNESIMIIENKPDEETHYFCCKGCEGVYHLLNDSGLESFYDKKGSTTLTPALQNYDDSSHFDSDSFYKRFVKIDKDKLCEVALVIEGIHCSACVWLNEKALHQLDGVVEASINYSTNKAKIVWDDDIVKLSQIVEMIRAVGYNAFAYDRSIQEDSANRQRKDYYLRIAVAAFGTMNIMWIAISQYAGYFTGMEQSAKDILNIAEWILATPVLFYSGWIFFRGAYYALKNRIVNMDILVATGATLTYLYSIYITLYTTDEAYFDSVSMIITFVLLGKFLEVLSKKNVADTLDILNATVPNEVTLLMNGVQQSTNVNDVNVGDVVLLKAGEKVAIDGIVISGEGNIDESSLTGESFPIHKTVQSPIISGTSSIDAILQYRVEKDFTHSTLYNLISLLENALANKPKIEQLANRLSEHFSTVILLLSLVTFFVWWFWPHDFDTAFMVGISVIVIACPCALALATPMATLIGIGLGAKQGVLFKEAAHLETMAKIDILVLDKTGTLTHGKPSVVNVHNYNDYDVSLLNSLVNNSLHPISKAIRDYLDSAEQTALKDIKSVSGLGIKAFYNNKIILGGNEEFMKLNSIMINKIESSSSLFYFAIEDKHCATFELQDKLKEDAKESIAYFKSQNIEVVMLTGDNLQNATQIAQEVGISEVHANLKPQDKAQHIIDLKSANKNIIMTGDGVNDILALAHADIAIAMGSGSDIAIEVSDIVLLNSSLTSLTDAMKISKRTFKLIKENLALSLVYNAITIPLAMMGFIIPLIAAISMSISSLLVVGNSLRIRYNWNKNK
jgi:P-type Cu+ transporter